MADITYRDILNAALKGHKALNEASLGRVLQHIQRMDQKSWGILSAHRAEYRTSNPQVNIQNDKALQGYLRGQQLGFFRLVGIWKECQDASIPYSTCPEEKKVEVREPSLFVPGLTLDQLRSLLVKYQQDAGVYGGPETKGKVWLIFKDGGHESIGEFSPSKIGGAYSRVKGKPFVFEWQAQSYVDGVIRENWLRERGAVGAMTEQNIMAGVRLLSASPVGLTIAYGCISWWVQEPTMRRTHVVVARPDEREKIKKDCDFVPERERYNPADPEFSSVEAFVESLIDNERDSYTVEEALVLGYSLKRSVPALHKELAGYGLKREERAVPRTVRGFNTSSNDRWYGPGSCKTAGGSGGDLITGFVGDASSPG